MAARFVNSPENIARHWSSLVFLDPFFHMQHCMNGHLLANHGLFLSQETENLGNTVLKLHSFPRKRNPKFKFSSLDLKSKTIAEHCWNLLSKLATHYISGTTPPVWFCFYDFTVKLILMQLLSQTFYSTESARLSVSQMTRLIGHKLSIFPYWFVGCPASHISTYLHYILLFIHN